MKRLFVSLLILVSVFFVQNSDGNAIDWTGNINIGYGRKYLSENWSPQYEHDAYGLSIDFRTDKMPFHVVLEYLQTNGSAGNKRVWKYTSPFHGCTYKGDVETTEYHIGVRKIWDAPRSLHPYINFGIAFISASGSLEFYPQVVDFDYRGTGIWFGAGIFYTFLKHYNIGIDSRISSADMHDPDPDINGGGSHVRVILGHHF